MAPRAEVDRLEARDGVAVRPPVRAALDGRFSRRVTVLVARTGFGKTAAIDDAVRRASAVHDVVHTCTAADRDGEHLMLRLLAALGADAGPSSGQRLDRLLDGLWALAPDPVALVLDDLHLVPAGSSGADALRRLTGELPGNAHLVLSGQVEPPVSLARLVAQGQAVVIDEDDFALDEEDLAVIAGEHGVAVEAVDVGDRRPALVHLAATVGPEAAVGRPAGWLEATAHLSRADRAVLAVVAPLGTVDDAVVAALGGRGIEARDLVAGLPLVTERAGGVTLHPVLVEGLGHLTEVGDQPLIAPAGVATAADHLCDEGRHADAFKLAGRLRAGAVQANVARRLAREDAVSITVDELAAALTEMDSDAVSPGEQALLRAEVAEVDDPGVARRQLRSAADAFAAVGDHHGETTALLRRLLLDLWDPDVRGGDVRVGDIRDGPAEGASVLVRIEELAAAGSPAARSLQSLVAGFVHVFEGDPEGGLRELDHLDALGDPVLRGPLGLLRAIAHLDLGYPDRAHSALEVGRRAAVGRVATAYGAEDVEARLLAGSITATEAVVRLDDLVEDATGQAGSAQLVTLLARRALFLVLADRPTEALAALDDVVGEGLGRSLEGARAAVTAARWVVAAVVDGDASSPLDGADGLAGRPPPGSGLALEPARAVPAGTGPS